MVAIWFALRFFTAALLLARENDCYMINYRRVTNEQFLIGVRTLVACLSILALYMASIAFTLLRRLALSRALLLASFPITCLGSVAMVRQVLETPHDSDVLGSIIFAIFETLAAHW